MRVVKLSQNVSPLDPSSTVNSTFFEKVGKTFGLAWYLAQRHVENWISGLLAVRYISDPIMPLNNVSLTETPESSGPKLFGGSIGHFTEAQLARSYFLSKSLTYFLDK
ncbi:hypothetical protein Tco_0825165 [Tanacetum coccineum]